MANDFLYIREVSFQSFDSKEYFSRYHDGLEDLGKISQKLFEEEGETLLDKIRVF
jgi:hypothetical protein